MTVSFPLAVPETVSLTEVRYPTDTPDHEVTRR
jgi:hypothetical protein